MNLNSAKPTSFSPASKSSNSYRKEAPAVALQQQKWEELKTGSESAFIWIYSTFFNDLVRYGYQITNEIELVEDCVQDLFIDLRKNRSKLPELKFSLKHYLFKSLKNKILLYYRSRKMISLERTLVSYLGFQLSPSIEETLIIEQTEQESIQQIRNAINGLPFRQREALFYLYYENLSYQEIKSLLELDNERSARNLVYKAIASLRQKLDVQQIGLILSLLSVC
jgi:RNA polymerase sigma-70 factor (ECF subfamily)